MGPKRETKGEMVAKPPQRFVPALPAIKPLKYYHERNYHAVSAIEIEIICLIIL